jgi:hypothetical protein
MNRKFWNNYRPNAGDFVGRTPGRIVAYLMGVPFLFHHLNSFYMLKFFPLFSATRVQEPFFQIQIALNLNPSNIHCTTDKPNQMQELEKIKRKMLQFRSNLSTANLFTSSFFSKNERY